MTRKADLTIADRLRAARHEYMNTIDCDLDRFAADLQAFQSRMVEQKKIRLVGFEKRTSAASRK